MTDELRLTVGTSTPGNSGVTNSRNISGWTSVRVQRGIERCPSSFDISFTELYPGAADLLVQPGDACQVFLGNDLVLTGYIDRYQPAYSGRDHTISVSGRSKCQDIVDCSAHWTNHQLPKLTVPDIAKLLCKAYGVEVSVLNGTNVGEPIAQTNISPGESIYDVLERVCRYRGLLLFDDVNGNLVLASGSNGGNDGEGNSTGSSGSSTKAAGTTPTASGTLKEGVNVQAASLTWTMDTRFSDYDAVYHGLDTLKETGDAGNVKASVKDPEVPRFRYRAIVAENASGGAQVAKQRVNWELARRKGRSQQVSVTVGSWRDANGVLWTPNTLVSIELPSLKLEPKTWLISEVTYRRDNNGTSAELVIMPPEAFLQDPTQKPPTRRQDKKVN
ncbi:phage baseplate assembly protein [Trinickia fusca]|uniref:Phage tail protein n=1 Tax=Trinickia fusca TaxID=2419777 RepID=A0A494XQQ4_9BURK|nr:contractile injection system protein, VgrG/Pvc8 family [Trinickia fusca]RKP50509.1 phage tail protein [Trinickia fusca]